MYNNSAIAHTGTRCTSSESGSHFLIKMAFLISLLVLTSLIARVVHSSIVVDTTAGKVRGMEREANGTMYRVFFGIPYAEPPMGSLRFSAPVAKAPWDSNGNGVRDATAFGKSCPQDEARLTAFAPGWVRVSAQASKISEDCLTLNVYTPVAGNDTSTPLAVMVWLHGGSYRNGFGSIYDPSQLALKGEVVVVTLNYRLGPFGFLYTGDENAPGNVGLMDQQLALQWVQDNIRAFGGDPSSVTLFSQADVHGSPTVHMFAKASQYLFHRVVAHSGVIQTEDIQDWSKAIEETKLFADSANCPTGSSGALLECLRGKTFQEIVDTYEPFFSRRKRTSFAWRPIVTRDFFELPGNSLPYDLLSVFNSGDGSVGLELIKDLFPDFRLDTGATEDQFKQWLDVNIDKADVIDIAVDRQYVETEAENKSVARMEGLFDIQLDRTFYRYGVQALRDLRPLLKSSRLMIFDHRSSSETRFPDPYDLVPHGAELPYVFGLPYDESGGIGAQFSDEERVLSLCMIRYWSNFAKTGDPNVNVLGDAPSTCNRNWPEYGYDEYLLVNIAEATVGEKYRSDGVDFWAEYLEELEAALEDDCPATELSSTPKGCEDPVIGERLGLALTPQQTESLIEAFIFAAVALLCLCLIIVGVACGYKYRHKALSNLHYQSMATEEEAVGRATGVKQANGSFQRDEESAGTSGSSSSTNLDGEQAGSLPQKHLPGDDSPRYADQRRSHKTFSVVKDERALNDHQYTDVDVMFPPPPGDVDDGDDSPDDSIGQEGDLPPPPEEDRDDDIPHPLSQGELEELNLSDEFRIPDEVTSSPATTVSSGADPDAQRIRDGGDDDDGSDDGSLGSEPDSSEPSAEEEGGNASNPADNVPQDDFHSQNRRQSDNFYDRLSSAVQ